MLVAVHTAWRLTHPKRHWRPHGWRPAPLPLQAVSFTTADGLRLRGWVASRPDAPAVAVCVHGWSANHTEMEWQAKRLYDAGFAVLLYDQRACGDSEGSTTSVGVLETLDLRAALHFARTHPGLQGMPIVVLANSMGAAVALTVAAEDTSIRAVFSDAAFTSLESGVAWGFRAATRVPAGPFQKIVVWLSQLICGARMSDLDVVGAVGRIAPRPVCFAHGLEDRHVSPDDARSLWAEAGQPKELWLVAGAGHVVGAHVDPEEYAARVARFFTAALSADPGAAGR